MAFQTYADRLKGVAQDEGISRRGFKRFEPEPEKPPKVVKQEPQPRMDSPIFQGSEGMRVSKENNAKREKEMIMRAVFGEVGSNKEGDYSQKLNQELIDPAQPMSEAEGKFRADPFAVEKLKRGATKYAPKSATPKTGKDTDQTEQGLAYASTFKPGQKIQVGVDADRNPIMEPVTFEMIKRDTFKRFKHFNPNDPRWSQIENDWRDSEPVPEPPKPGLYDRIKSAGKSAISKIRSTNGTPDDRIDTQKPGATRVFTHGDLPATEGHAEGSFLKTNGMRTHRLVSGQWQPIK